MIPEVTGTITNRQKGGGGLGDFENDGGLIPDVVGTLSDGAHNGGGLTAKTPTLDGYLPSVAGCLQERDAKGQDSDTKPGHLIVAPRGGSFDDAPTHTLRGEGFDASEDGTGRGNQRGAATLRSGSDSPASHGKQNGTDRETLVIAHLNGTDIQMGVEIHNNLSAGNAKQPDCLIFDTTNVTHPENRSNPQVGDPCHPLAAGAHPPAIAFSSKNNGEDAVSDQSPTLRAMGHKDSHPNAGGQVAIAFSQNQLGELREGEVSGTMAGNSNPSGRAEPLVRLNMGIRRLTPTECERLQAWPDHWTLTRFKKLRLVGNKWEIIDATPINQADGPRYKQIGNGVTASVPEWIGGRMIRFSNAP